MCIVGNNMPQFMQTLECALGDKVLARAYFWTFYLLLQYWILNVFMSVFIDDFIREFHERKMTEDRKQEERLWVVNVDVKADEDSPSNGRTMWVHSYDRRQYWMLAQ